MTLEDLAAQCVQQIDLAGPKAEVLVTMRGRCNKTMRKRFCRGGPVGRINGEDMTDPRNRVVVFFVAEDLLAFLACGPLAATCRRSTWRLHGGGLSRTSRFSMRE